MTLEDLYSYYLSHGIRAAAKAAKMRPAKLQSQFEAAGLSVRRQVDVDRNTALKWHQMYLSGKSIPEVMLFAEVSSRRILRAFKQHGLEVKSKEQVQAEKTEKTKVTNRGRYGVENVMQVASVVETLKESLQLRTDEERIATANKRRQTSRGKYGNDYFVTTEEFRLKSEAKFLEKHGVKTPSLVPSIVSKRTQTRHTNRAHSLGKILAERGYELLEQYIGNRITDIKGKHVRWRVYKLRHSCGCEFEDDVAMFPRCPQCYPLNRSLEEVELEHWLLGWGEDVEHSVRNLIVNPRTGKPFEIDLLLRARNVGIEYNGSFYHAGRKDHGVKSDLCLAQGVLLYHVWDFNNPVTIMSELSSLLGLTPSIEADVCSVQEINVERANIFMSEYHMQGSTLVSYAYGLFYENALVSVLTLRRTTGMLEIARFCTRHFTRVVGGFQKLLAAVRRQFKEPLLTYADRDWCAAWQDSVYAKSGFSFEGDTGSILRYVNVRTLEVSSRECFQRHKLQALFPHVYTDDATSHEMLAKVGIVPIWNSGNFKFVSA